jgi:predicted nucleotidyltransferase
MGVISGLVDHILSDPLLVQRRVVGVWLFGSFARGEARPDSDIDLAILCDPPLQFDRVILMERLARATGREVDVIDLSTAPPSLVWEVITTGEVLTAPDPAALADFTLRARWAADDDAHRNRMILWAQTGRPPGAGA